MKKIFLGLVAVMSLSSCATIITGSKQSISFTSTPSDATVFIDGKDVGKTPYQTKLKRKDSHNIEIKLEGYKPYTVQLKKSFNAWYLGNILFGGIIGLVIDPITGAIFRLTPTEVNAQLENGMAFNNDGDNIYIAVSMTQDPKWEKIGNLEK